MPGRRTVGGGELLDMLALGEDPDLDVVLRRVLRTARRVVRARYAALGIPDGRGGFARFVTSGISERRAALIGELPRTHGVLGALLEEGPILLGDIRRHPRFGYYPPHHPLLTDFLGVPIRHRDTVVGNLFVSGRGPAGFTRRDQRVLEGLAAYAGVAIANADLYNRAQELAIVEERTRIARELHDAATQTIFGLVLAARAAALSVPDERSRDQLLGFEGRAASALQELRGLVRALRPTSLERDGLPATLLESIDSLRAGGTDIEAEVDPSVRLPLDAEHGLLRIAQEAVNNAMRHAPGARIRVSLQRHDAAIVLRVGDSGPGFDPATAQAHGGMGLSTMRERAKQLRAALSVESRAGAGTRVTLRLQRPRRG